MWMTPTWARCRRRTPRSHSAMNPSTPPDPWARCTRHGHEPSRPPIRHRRSPRRQSRTSPRSSRWRPPWSPTPLQDPPSCRSVAAGVAASGGVAVGYSGRVSSAGLTACHKGDDTRDDDDQGHDMVVTRVLVPVVSLSAGLI